MPDRVKDQIAIVTGGLSGIGEAIVRRFRAEGAIVVAADITATGPDRLDVSDPASCAELVASVMRRHGRIDALVNCAGIGRDIPFLETPVAVFDQLIAVNLRGTFLIGQECARRMTSGASIVNIASVAAVRGSEGRAAYGASKGGVVTLSQVMATELAPSGIRVNVIAPGAVDTPLVAKMHDAAIRADWIRATPMHRYSHPDEIAGSAVYLCSADASFVTGHVLAVDGGFTGAGLQRSTRNAT